MAWAPEGLVENELAMNARAASRAAEALVIMMRSWLGAVWPDLGPRVAADCCCCQAQTTS
jgi:hypothetical protein